MSFVGCIDRQAPATSEAERRSDRVARGSTQLVELLLLRRSLPIGPKVVPFGGSYLEFYKVIPKRNYFGAYG